MNVKKTLLTVLILLIVVTLLFVPLKSALVFYKENTNVTVAYLPLTVGDQFDIIFTHSIHLTDVEERYHVAKDLTIVQDEIIFESFGIGMPSTVEEGEVYEYINGRHHITNLNNVCESMNIRNGKTVSQHRLRWKHRDEGEQQMVWFNDYFEPGSWYTVKIDKLSLLEYWKGVKIDD